MPINDDDLDLVMTFIREHYPRLDAALTRASAAAPGVDGQKALAALANTLSPEIDDDLRALSAELREGFHRDPAKRAATLGKVRERAEIALSRGLPAPLDEIARDAIAHPIFHLRRPQSEARAMTVAVSPPTVDAPQRWMSFYWDVIFGPYEDASLN